MKWKGPKKDTVISMHSFIHKNSLHTLAGFFCCSVLEHFVEVPVSSTLFETLTCSLSLDCGCGELSMPEN